MAANNNQRLRYRPLWAGTMICSSEVQRSGTIGFFGTRNGVDRWCVTAAHVVSHSRKLQAEVWQPKPDLRDLSLCISQGPMVYAHGLDLVAFELDDAVQIRPGILDLGLWSGIKEPVKDMVVMKSGSSTGVTRGRIVAVRGHEFDVLPELGMPDDYVGYDQGDSGAAWMTADGRSLVGIHFARAISNGVGIAVSMHRALQALQLRLI